MLKTLSALVIAGTFANEIADINLNEKDRAANLEKNGLAIMYGTPIKLSVKGNPTTGYTWNLD